MRVYNEFFSADPVPNVDFILPFSIIVNGPFQIKIHLSGKVLTVATLTNSPTPKHKSWTRGILIPP